MQSFKIIIYKCIQILSFFLSLCKLTTWEALSRADWPGAAAHHLPPATHCMPDAHPMLPMTHHPLQYLLPTATCSCCHHRCCQLHAQLSMVIAKVRNCCPKMLYASFVIWFSCLGVACGRWDTQVFFRVACLCSYDDGGGNWLSVPHVYDSNDNTRVNNGVSVSSSVPWSGFCDRI